MLWEPWFNKTVSYVSVLVFEVRERFWQLLPGSCLPHDLRATTLCAAFK
jgi:hypothetical protein